MPLKVSIIINTYNRASTLQNTLRSLQYLNYPDFEVIVVNGPSTDNTGEVIEKFAGNIKAGACPAANLSISRNIGICMAKGDICAFIDDDAIPEPEWLDGIVAGYDRDDVGGVGGFVYNHTGYEFQAKYIICNRFGDARFESDVNPTRFFNFPLSHEYCALIGTNATFRRDVLLKVGGFDRQYDYYLDETDVCVRVVDAGYMIKFVDDAIVHHKFAPSHIRNEKKMVLRWHPIAKNKAYFAIKNSARTHSTTDLLNNLITFAGNISNGISQGLKHGALNKEQYDQYNTDLHAGLKQGFVDGMNKRREFITPEEIEKYSAPYKRFEKPAVPERLVICFLSRDFPPAHNGGIGRFTHDLAKGIGRLGHHVHVITLGKSHNTVDFEDGVWVHRILCRRQEDKTMLPGTLSVPESIWDLSCSFYKEVLRINDRHKIDVVESPIWDVEGLCCVLDKNLKTVVNLETTYAIALHTHKEWEKNREYKRDFVDKIIEAEKYIYDNATALHAISRAIITSIEKESRVTLPEDRTSIVPLGVIDRSAEYIKLRLDDDVMVLFVGRLENRKGIDVLLECIPAICEKHRKVRFVIVGDDSIRNEDGKLYKDEFIKSHDKKHFMERVRFTGKVSEEDLYQYYANCDIFVAPSRFESFGLIFLEAMQFGKPVIGCREGGMVEIIAEGVNGLLAEPGNSKSLGEAIEYLVLDTDARKRYGAMSRKIYEDKYTAEKMVEGTLDFYYKLLGKKTRPPAPCNG